MAREWEKHPEARDVADMIADNGAALQDMIDDAAAFIVSHLQSQHKDLSRVKSAARREVSKQIKFQEEDLSQAIAPSLENASNAAVENAVALNLIQQQLIFGDGEHVTTQLQRPVPPPGATGAIGGAGRIVPDVEQGVSRLPPKPTGFTRDAGGIVEAPPRVGTPPVPPPGLTCGSICVSQDDYATVVVPFGHLFTKCVWNIAGYWQCDFKCGLAGESLTQAQELAKLYPPECQPGVTLDCSTSGNPACCTFYCDPLSKFFDPTKCQGYPCGQPEVCCFVINTTAELSCAAIGVCLAPYGDWEVLCPQERSPDGAFHYLIPGMSCADAAKIAALLATGICPGLPGGSATFSQYHGSCPAGPPPPPPPPPPPCEPCLPPPPCPPAGECCCPTWTEVIDVCGRMETVSGKGADCLPPVADLDTPGYFHFAPGVTPWRRAYFCWHGIDDLAGVYPSANATVERMNPILSSRPEERDKSLLLPPQWDFPDLHLAAADGRR